MMMILRDNGIFLQNIYFDFTGVEGQTDFLMESYIRL
jgi:hypothetical protein